MMKISLILCYLAFANLSYSQTYIYTFDGELNPFSITEMENTCSKFQSIEKVKIKYKQDAKKGEFIIILNPKEKEKRAEADNHFSPIDIKTYMLENQLTPLSFRIIHE